MHHKNRQILARIIYILLAPHVLVASSLNYTNNQTYYASVNHVFKQNEEARGFVRFNEGFTVMPDACATLDLLFSVSGSLDLRETGTIRLLKNLNFDSGVTLTTGGSIDGRGNKIILAGDFAIPAGKILHINGNTIIDGQGNTITINKHAQIFIDTDITLTLCNITISNKQHAPTFPPIRCGATTSKLTLNNVTLSPFGDFLFPQGQLFVHNDVLFTGTSAFIYTSPVPSLITSGACLYFDQGTTFSIAPATFTDAPYTLKNTYTSNNFIQMADATSALYLNGCTLQTTLTGVRFSKGSLLFDNNVQCKSQTALVLTSTGIQLDTKNLGVTGNIVYQVRWSPNGKYLATGGVFGVAPYRGNQLTIYRFDGSLLTTCTNSSYGTGSSAYVSGISWSPDGRYVAAVGSPTTPSLSGYQLQVYQFNGSALTVVAKITLGGVGYNVHWSPDGQMLAVTGVHQKLKIYRFNGSTLTLITETTAFSTSTNTVEWSPNGRYLILVLDDAAGGPEIYIYQFDGTTLSSVTSAEYGSVVQGASWSPDGRYVAIAGWNNSQNLVIYRFDGTNLIPIAPAVYNDTTSWSAWSPDGRYISINGSSSNNNGNEVRIYKFDGTNLSLIRDAQINCGSGSFAMACTHWSHDAKYLAIGGDIAPTPVPGETHAQVEVYKLGYIQDAATQAHSKSIVFGDSRYGSSRDALVTVLAGAHVELTGRMSDDNFNG